MTDIDALDVNLPGYAGWEPDDFDSRDRVYVSPISVPRWGSAVDLRAEYPTSWIDVYDQGGTGMFGSTHQVVLFH